MWQYRGSNLEHESGSPVPPCNEPARGLEVRGGGLLCTRLWFQFQFWFGGSIARRRNLHPMIRSRAVKGPWAGRSFCALIIYHQENHHVQAICICELTAITTHPPSVHMNPPPIEFCRHFNYALCFFNCAPPVPRNNSHETSPESPDRCTPGIQEVPGVSRWYRSQQSPC